MLRYKIDVLAALKDKGYTTYKLRKEKLLGEGTIQSLRSSPELHHSPLDTICQLLECQPGDVVEYVPDEAPPEDDDKPQGGLTPIPNVLYK